MSKKWLFNDYHIQPEAYSELVANAECPLCHEFGMIHEGGFECRCPCCGFEGTLNENGSFFDDEDL